MEKLCGDMGPNILLDVPNYPCFLEEASFTIVLISVGVRSESLVAPSWKSWIVGSGPYVGDNVLVP